MCSPTSRSLNSRYCETLSSSGLRVVTQMRRWSHSPALGRTAKARHSFQATTSCVCCNAEVPDLKKDALIARQKMVKTFSACHYCQLGDSIACEAYDLSSGEQQALCLERQSGLSLTFTKRANPESLISGCFLSSASFSISSLMM